MALPFSVVIKDKEGCVIWCNRRFEMLAHGKLEELKGLTSTEIFGLPHLNLMVEAERLLIATGKSTQETQFVPPDLVRQTVRFGIFDPSGAVDRIGAIAVEVRLALSLDPASVGIDTQLSVQSVREEGSKTLGTADELQERRKLIAL